MAVIYPHSHDSSGNTSYTHLTFQQLDNRSNLLAAAFNRQGMAPGQRCALMVSPGLDFFAITFALFKLGVIPVLIDPGMGIKNIKTCLEEAQPQAFIGIPKAHIARKLLSWGKGTITLNITTGCDWLRDSVSLNDICTTDVPAEFDCYKPSNEDTAAILFTSGSTGVPKGVIYTHRNFNTQIETLRTIYNIQPGEIDLCTFPLFALFAPALGMTAVIPDMDATRPALVDADKIFSAIDDFGVTNMFGSPALLRRVAAAGVKQKKQLPTLQRVISAGAPVPATVLEQFGSMLNAGVAIYTPYGATEALPVCSIDSHTILQSTRTQTDEGRGICVGTAVPNVEINIISITDEAISRWNNELCVNNGVIGELCVKGNQVTDGYYNRPESTSLAKIYCDNGEFYHRMGDLGYRDDSGRIWFCGRKSHRVQTEHNVLYTIPCEAVFNTHPLVYRTALTGIGAKGKQQAVLCIELLDKADKQLQQKIVAELRAIQTQFPHTTEIKHFLFHKQFPVDIRHNAKIFREKLAIWAEKQLKQQH